MMLDNASTLKVQMGRHPASGHLDQRRTAHPQDDSLEASSGAVRSAPVGPPAAAAARACLTIAGRSRHAAVLANDQIVMDTCHAAQAIEWYRRGRCRRARRASIANVEHRTPDLYSRNQPRTNTVPQGGKGSTCRAAQNAFGMDWGRTKTLIAVLRFRLRHHRQPAA